MRPSHDTLRILYIEPFNGGSHAQFTETLTNGVSANWTVLTLPGRHWKWRARGAGVFLATHYAKTFEQEYDILFAGSFLPLADLLALHPRLTQIPRVLYFHENQLAYPVREHQPRDHHFGFSQLVSALAATHCVFNSQWNMRSFLTEGSRLLSRMPDAIPQGWVEKIEQRSTVLPLPLRFPDLPVNRFQPSTRDEREQGPLILWNHRWEFDKQPELFFKLMEGLRDHSAPFRLAVCGEQFRRMPPCFERARVDLAQHIIHWGYGTKEEYAGLLARAHIAVSTAAHEFFGVSMLEAVFGGAYPLVPNRLVYPEHFPKEYLYESQEDALTKLIELCTQWTAGDLDLRRERSDIVAKFGHKTLARYETFFRECHGFDSVDGN